MEINSFKITRIGLGFKNARPIRTKIKVLLKTIQYLEFLSNIATRKKLTFTFDVHVFD